MSAEHLMVLLCVGGPLVLLVLFVWAVNRVGVGGGTQAREPRPRPVKPERAAVDGEGAVTLSGVQLIAAERWEQTEKHGYTPDHDANEKDGALLRAAGCYIEESILCHELPEAPYFQCPNEWPWEEWSWKPRPDPIGNLVKAGALIAAEIDRLQRAEKGITRKGPG